MSIESKNPFGNRAQESELTPVKDLRNPKSSSADRIMLWLAVMLTVVCLSAVFLPKVQVETECDSPRKYCQNNMRWIGVALHNYHSSNGFLPPAHTVDKQGESLHSWRTLILQDVEEAGLYYSIDHKKSWDDPANDHARKAKVRGYQCRLHQLEPGYTTYLANAWEKGVLAPAGNNRKFNDITDGLSNTIAILEVPAEMAVEWMSPRDANLETLSSLVDQKLQPHQNGINVVYADGSVHWIKLVDAKATPEERRKRVEALKPLMTISEGDGPAQTDLFE